MHDLEPIDSDDDGTVFRDVIMLALLGFVTIVVLLLPHLNPPVKASEPVRPPGNVVVERQVGSWAVTGVFDLMTCAFGDGEEDLPRTTAEFARSDRDAARAFVEAYRLRRPTRPGARERFRLYMLADRLVLWEYGRRAQEWFKPELRFRDFARGFIELDSLLDDT